jgi:nicotinamide mononucleotide transporter
MQVLDFFSVNTIAFDVLGYPMSYIEFIGTIFYLWSVWLISRRNMLTWPIGIISVILYAILFYQIQLYADTFEQIYYLGVSIYGWWYWIRDKNKDKKDKVGVYFSPKKSILKWATATLIVSIILSYVDSKLNVLVPEIFTTPASFPFLDTLTTIMSLTAMFLMARKRIESWVYWIIVDVIGIWLYYVKDVRFISLLYVILFVMALNGLKSWTNTRRTTAQVSK